MWRPSHFGNIDFVHTHSVGVHIAFLYLRVAARPLWRHCFFTHVLGNHLEVLQRQLGVMDLTAISLCMETKLPILVFNLMVEGNIERAVAGEPIGTLIQ